MRLQSSAQKDLAFAGQSPPDGFAPLISGPTCGGARAPGRRPRATLVVQQDLQQFLVRSEDVGLVPRSEAGPSAGWGLADARARPPPDRYYRGPRREVLHGQAIEPAPVGDRQPADQKGTVLHVKSANDLQAQGGSHEPRSSEGGGGADLAKAEADLDRVGQHPVEDAQDGRP